MNEPEKHDQEEDQPDPPITYCADIYADQRMIDSVHGRSIVELAQNLLGKATEIEVEAGTATTYSAEISADQPGRRRKKRPSPVQGTSITELAHKLIDDAARIEDGAATALARASDRPISTTRHPKRPGVPRRRRASPRTLRRRSGR